MKSLQLLKLVWNKCFWAPTYIYNNSYFHITIGNFLSFVGHNVRKMWHWKNESSIRWFIFEKIAQLQTCCAEAAGVWVARACSCYFLLWSRDILYQLDCLYRVLYIQKHTVTHTYWLEHTKLLVILYSVYYYNLDKPPRYRVSLQKILLSYICIFWWKFESFF